MLYWLALSILCYVCCCAHAAKLSVGQVIYFDTTYSSCDMIPNFEALDASNNGMLFLGDTPLASNAGYWNGRPAMVNGTENTHTHTGGKQHVLFLSLNQMSPNPLFYTSYRGTYVVS